MTEAVAYPTGVAFAIGLLLAPPLVCPVHSASITLESQLWK